MHTCAVADGRMRHRAADVVQAASVIRLIEQIGDVDTLIGMLKRSRNGGTSGLSPALGDWVYGTAPLPGAHPPV